jgi:hypothetical protein
MSEEKNETEVTGGRERGKRRGRKDGRAGTFESA